MENTEHAYLTAVTTTPHTSKGVAPAPGIRVATVSGDAQVNIALIEVHNSPCLDENTLISLAVEYLATDVNDWSDFRLHASKRDGVAALTLRFREEIQKGN